MAAAGIHITRVVITIRGELICITVNTTGTQGMPNPYGIKITSF